MKRLFSKAKQSFWDFQWLLLVRWSAKHRNEEFFWWTEGEPKKLLISVRSTSQNQQKSLEISKRLVSFWKKELSLNLELKLDVWGKNFCQNYVFLCNFRHFLFWCLKNSSFLGNVQKSKFDPFSTAKIRFSALWNAAIA